MDTAGVWGWLSGTPRPTTFSSVLAMTTRCGARVWGSSARAGSVRRDVAGGQAGQVGGMDDSLSLLTGVVHLLSHSSNRSFTLRETEHLLCTLFSWGTWGLKASFLSSLEFCGLEENAHILCLVTS